MCLYTSVENKREIKRCLCSCRAMILLGSLRCDGVAFMIAVEEYKLFWKDREDKEVDLHFMRENDVMSWNACFFRHG